jgi:uncharacterized membrane protein YccC
LTAILVLYGGMPSLNELVFALKTFAGAMTALALAFWLGLDNPYWSMATAFIVAQPLTGAMRSKALYRFIGTFVGGVAAVVMIPNLVNAPVLLSLAMATWIGLCLYLSLLDRSARAYLFMLAGYSAGIIGFPTIAAPGTIFHVAVTRVEEISIGIVCTSLFGTVLFPRPLGPVLAARIVAWVKPAAEWAAAALAGEQEDAEAKASRRRMAAEATDISMMTTQLAFDTSHLNSATRHVVRLRLYVLSLMPIISSIGDRVLQLRELGGIPPRLQTLLGDCGEWISHGYDAPNSVPDGLLAEISAQEREGEDHICWEGILRTTLLVRLQELISMVRHARLIRHHVIDNDASVPVPGSDPVGLAALHQLRDHSMALLSAFAAGFSLLLVCVFWIYTGWSYGAGAALMATIACSFFAAQDDPAPAIALMIRNSFIALAGSGFYLFVILPRVETFAELALVLLPAGLIIGVLISRPATFGTGMVLGAFGATDLALNDGYAGNFEAFINGGVALILGLTAALIITRLIRSVGAAWSARRLLRAGWRDIAMAATTEDRAGRPVHDRAHLTGIMLDRLGLLMPRLAAVSPGADIAAADVLADLRVGLNAIGLQHELKYLSEVERQQTLPVLAGVAGHYRGNPLQPADDSLLNHIDKSILLIAENLDAAHEQHHREALMLLVGLRSVLFRETPSPFQDMAMAA